MNTDFAEVQLKLTHPGKTASNTPITSPDSLYEFMKDILKERPYECVYVVTLSTTYKPINYALVGKGGASESTLSISDIAKLCLLSNASACIIVHNHLSSGTPKPSRKDDETARELNHILLPLNITLCDFVITSPDSYYSYLNEHRAPYNKLSCLYNIRLPFPDLPHITLLEKTRMSYVQKLFDVSIDTTGFSVSSWRETHNPIS